MNRDLIINIEKDEAEIALLENNQLVELHQDKATKSITVGDIFIGRIKKLIPGLNAAFVDIGHRKDAFLHYTDLGPAIRSLNKFLYDTLSGKQKTYLLGDFKFEPETVKTGKIDKIFKQGQKVLIQIEKEPISTKGARISCEITLAGRYFVLYPFYNYVSVSKKIADRQERQRLTRLAESIKPKNFGLIIRTVAEGKKVAELNDDLQSLVAKWEKTYSGIVHSDNARTNRPVKVLSEERKYKNILRDLLNASFNNIVINDPALVGEIKSYVSKIAPGLEKIVKVHKSDIPIFDKYNVSKQIKSLFGSIVNLTGGAYLVIEKTEALTVIDVNSGQKVDATKDIETNAQKVNLEAAQEIARQMRLRDLGGIIVIDFIDIKHPTNKKNVYESMKEEMKNDRARHAILPLSKFNLMQITRQRVRPATNVETSEVCPTCQGKEEINASILLVEEIGKKLISYFQEKDQDQYKNLKLYAHPYVVAYIKQGVVSLQTKWLLKFKKWVKVIPDYSYPLTEYHFFNDKGIID